MKASFLLLSGSSALLFKSHLTHCQFEANFSKNCTDTMTAFTKVVSEKDTLKPRSTYSLGKVEPESSIAANRVGIIGKQDIEFLFEKKGDSSCKVVGKSQFQDPQFYDYEANYCNLRNVF